MEVAIGREKSFRAPQDMSWESRDGLGQGSWFPAALSRCGLVLGDGVRLCVDAVLGPDGALEIRGGINYLACSPLNNLSVPSWGRFIAA